MTKALQTTWSTILKQLFEILHQFYWMKMKKSIPVMLIIRRQVLINLLFDRIKLQDL